MRFRLRPMGGKSVKSKTNMTSERVARPHPKRYDPQENTRHAPTAQGTDQKGRRRVISYGERTVAAAPDEIGPSTTNANGVSSGAPWTSPRTAGRLRLLDQSPSSRQLEIDTVTRTIGVTRLEPSRRFKILADKDFHPSSRRTQRGMVVVMGAHIPFVAVWTVPVTVWLTI